MASFCAQTLGKVFRKEFLFKIAIFEALIAVSFLQEQHPFVPALIQLFPSSPIFSLSYVRDYELAALEQNGHNCLECFLFFCKSAVLICWGHL